MFPTSGVPTLSVPVNKVVPVLDVGAARVMIVSRKFSLATLNQGMIQAARPAATSPFFKEKRCLRHGAGAVSAYTSSPPGVACSTFSATIASVVMSRAAMEAAPCSARRTTLVGSMMPTFIMST